MCILPRLHTGCLDASQFVVRVGNQLKNGLDLIIDYFGCFGLD